MINEVFLTMFENSSPTLSLIAPVSYLELFLRLGLSFIAGAMIGLEREDKDKSAGLRTNMLVCFGSTIFVLIPIELGMAQRNPDSLGRIISGIIGGVGFIGAGTIFHLSSSTSVKGLTSAATIWISSALGITIGCGLWVLGISGTIFAWIILRIFARFT
jgi:putative Mg2+ transporter-C (MgtC) family protein